MEDLTIINGQNNETYQVQTNFDQTTIGQLKQELITTGQINAPQPGHEYRIAGKNNEILSDNVSLKDAGFKSGDSATLLDKGLAAYWDQENDDADNADEDNGSCDESPSGAAG